MRRSCRSTRVAYFRAGPADQFRAPPAGVGPASLPRMCQRTRRLGSRTFAENDLQTPQELDPLLQGQKFTSPKPSYCPAASCFRLIILVSVLGLVTCAEPCCQVRSDGFRLSLYYLSIESYVI